MLPFYTLVPPLSPFPDLSGHAWVPIDDENTPLHHVLVSSVGTVAAEDAPGFRGRTPRAAKAATPAVIRWFNIR